MVRELPPSRRRSPERDREVGRGADPVRRSSESLIPLPDPGARKDTVMLPGTWGVKLSPSIEDLSRRVKFRAMISTFPNEPFISLAALKTESVLAQHDIAIWRV